MRERVIDKNLHQVSEFESTSSFLAVESVPAGISTIWDKGLPIDLLVSPTASDTTVFFFHGAIERHFTLPVLSGQGISGAIKANRVFVSDPSLILDDELMLAWYAGNYQQRNLQEVLTAILRKIAESLGSKRMVFFGGSGGGFASLYFASHFDNSLALVFNPQTNIANYSARAVQDFVVKGFRAETDLTAPLSHLPPEVVTDVCEIYATVRNTTVAYIQNRNDTTHVEAQLVPFLRAFNYGTDFLLLHEPWRDGHYPPPKDLLIRLLNLAVTSNDWVKDLYDFGFDRNPQATYSISQER